MSTTSTASPQRPAYLAGRFAPVPDEIDAVDLPVEGTLPPELDGRYLRNGPNPRPGEDPGHWFLGHGMLHGVRLAGGRAQWYRNRWVRTGAFAGHPSWREDGTYDRTAVVANTHVISHAGRLFALVESGFPYEIDGELGTIGPCDFGGRLTTGMTAHPKTDPVTGELHFFGYSPVPPFLTYHRLSAAGELVVSRTVDVPGPTMMHDFAITEHHVVWLDLPMTFSSDLLGRGMPYVWDESYGARLGVMAFDDPASRVQWFEIDPCFVFHVGTAHEDASGRVVLDGARYAAADAAAMWTGLPAGRSSRDGQPRTASVTAAAATGAARMHRWTTTSWGATRGTGTRCRPPPARTRS
jgi:carotenoid cleavage dioxygenase-like enzyme